MLNSIKGKEDLEKLEELASLQNQVKVVRLQDKLGKQSSQEEMKNIFEPVNKTLEKSSQDRTKTFMETSNINNKALQNLNKELLEKLDDRGIMVSCLMSRLSQSTNTENSTQFKLVNEPSSNRVNYSSIKNTIPTNYFT